MSSLLSHPSHALNTIVTPPVTGEQHVGQSPGGPLDSFAYAQAQHLLGNSDEQLFAVELIMGERFTCSSPCAVVITGAPRDTRINDQQLSHATVAQLNPGDTLTPGDAVAGFRTYVCARSLDNAPQPVIGLSRGNVVPLMRWQARGRIRVVPGPEWNQLENPSAFMNTAWRVSPDSSRMGLRLDGIASEVDQSDDMTSQPVNDGTVQMTPTGLIVLLRDRQTVGGYPRVINVISADVDLLAQYAPGQRIRFTLVNHDEATAIAEHKENCLSSWANSLTTT